MDKIRYLGGIYAILDTVAGQISGGLYLHKHEAAAIRFFADVASDRQTIIAKHPQDFDLLRVGYLTDDNHIHPDNTLILKGSTWAATQNDESPQEARARKYAGADATGAPISLAK